jgi:hypothetical protein
MYQKVIHSVSQTFATLARWLIKNQSLSPGTALAKKTSK